jgi:hypothetical protein
MKTDLKKPNWFPLPDPIQESEVNLTVQWTADERTAQAIERRTQPFPHPGVHSIGKQGDAGLK